MEKISETTIGLLQATGFWALRAQEWIRKEMLLGGCGPTLGLGVVNWLIVGNEGLDSKI